LYAASFFKKQLSTICIVNDVIYFFVRREIFERAVFELQEKKHLPFFSRFIKKEEIPLLCRSNYEGFVEDVA
jgi:hypothetical protein